MIIYNAKTKKVPLNLKEWNLFNNYKKILAYNPNLLYFEGNVSWVKDENVFSDVYYTYNILVSFNNSLTEENNLFAFNELKRKLDEHSNIQSSIDFRCRNYYEKMSRWYKIYISNPSDDNYNRVCNEIQELLAYLSKQEIVCISSCNVKRNFYS